MSFISPTIPCTEPVVRNVVATIDPSEQALVYRIYLLRMLGLGAGFFCVGGVFWANGASELSWQALILYAFAWPQLARWLAHRAKSPRTAELRNLSVDSACGGIWIALMQFNLLPSVLLAVMLAFDKLCLGGPKLLVRCLLMQLLTCAATTWLLGVTPQLETAMPQVWAALPLLILYPTCISAMTYRLTRTVSSQNRRLVQLSRTDGLTGLLNRPSWEHAAAEVLSRLRHSGQHAALLMVDFDYFKRINDAHGHLIGDEVIRSVADIIRGCIGSDDLPGRYGGDEFGIVLVRSNAQQAMRVAESIRAAVASVRPAGLGASMSAVSIGVAVNDDSTGDTRAWIKRADAALFTAKARGRDRVILTG